MIMIAGSPSQTAGESGGEPSGVPPDNTKQEFDYRMALVAADIKMVSLSQIDRDDQTFQYRNSTCPPCNPDDFIIESGGVDGATGPHPIVLQSQSKGKPYRIVSGFGRLDIMPDNDQIKNVKCFILRNGTDAEATIIAARANLAHGQVLTTKEKRRCFQKEMAAIKDGRYERPSICALGRAYGVARNTVKSWLNLPKAQSRQSPGTPRKSAGPGTKVGVAKQAPSQSEGKAAEPANWLAENDFIQADSDGVGTSVENAVAALRVAVDAFLEVATWPSIPEHYQTEILKQANRIRDYVSGISSNQREVA